jgi:hypothetical protein
VPEISVPHNWRPRPYQEPLWQALEGGVKRAVAVWHRRAGKDSVSLNWTVREAFRRPGMYWHIAPTYKQGRKIVWNGMTKEGRRFLDHWPEEAIIRARDDEMTLWLEGGSIWSVIGTDDVDSLVGTNVVGAVFSEYSLQNPAAWNYLRPILAENDGWALFIYTPRGRNHGHRLVEMAKENPNWFSQVLTVMDTKALHRQGEDLEAEPFAVQEERAADMPEETIQQEFYCSFDAPLVGAYYGEYLIRAKEEGRIGRVPYESQLPVDTHWDLGIGDANAIWFTQCFGREIRFIDYYQHSGVGFEHYSKILSEKPYRYGRHYGPHDLAVREYAGEAKARVETAREHGIPFEIVPKISRMEGIEAVRKLFPRFYFDEVNCATGLDALRQYVKMEIEGAEGPGGETIYSDTPKRNWATHGADALRTGATGGFRDNDWKDDFQQPPIGPVV